MYITLEYLIIIFSYHASNNRLISDFTPSHTSVNSLGHSRLHPLTSSDTNRTIIGRLIISQTMQHFTHNRPQLEAILRSNKVQNTKTVYVPLIRRRCNYTVNAALEKTVGEEMERVREIHRDAPGIRLDPLPLALRRAHLQCSNGLAE